MRVCLLYAFILCIIIDTRAQVGSTMMLDRLNNTIDSTSHFDNLRSERLRLLQENFKRSNDHSLSHQYAYFRELYEENKLFHFDTAFQYARKLLDISTKLDDDEKIVRAKLDLAFILLSAGMFKEMNETINEIRIAAAQDTIKANYYLLRGRYYYDLADYTSNDYFYKGYFKQAGEYLDSALLLFPSNSFESVYYRGLQQLKAGDFIHSFDNFNRLLQRPLTEHQYALTASTMSYVYQVKGDVQRAMDFQAMAAMADIRSSTKETFAVLNLSRLLLNQGDFTNASRYVRKAVDDASVYGARQRKFQVSALLPIIQSAEINLIRQQRTAWINYATVTSIILLLFSLLLIIIIRQNRNLKKAKKQISEANTLLENANERLGGLNTELQFANQQLINMNDKLGEANKIKDQYVGYFFTSNSQLFQKISRMKSQIDEHLHYGRINELKHVMNSLDIHEERAELQKNFDKAFLKLFPHFVSDFNALFEEGNRSKVHEGELLNTDMRIFALLRLGINDNEKIAEILEYSVKSIYAYRTKIRNRSKYSKEEFDRRVMGIRSI